MSHLSTQNYQLQENIFVKFSFDNYYFSISVDFFKKMSQNAQEKSSKKEFPIHDAIRNGNVLEVKEKIREYPGHINQPNENNISPLMFCSIFGNVHIAKSLVESGADINFKGGNSVMSAIHVAAYKGHLEIVKLLIESGTSLNERDKEMLTPLHDAARTGHFEVAKWLLENGANVNSIDEDGDTPLHLAVKSKNISIETIKILMDFGADFKKGNFEGKSALDESKTLPRKDVLNAIVNKMIEIQFKQYQIGNRKAIHVKIDECVICDNPREEIFSLYPCGHAKTCEVCCLKLTAMSSANSVCPICRSKIDDYKKIYF